MRRLIPFVLIILFAGVISLGFRGADWRGARTVAGDYTFSGEVNLGDAATDTVTITGVVRLLAETEIDGGNIIVADGQKIIITDGTEGDSITIYDNGSNSYIDADNSLNLRPLGGFVLVAGHLQLEVDENALISNGYRFYLDYDSDDSLSWILFDKDEGDTLKCDTISHKLTFTGAGGIQADKYVAIDNAETVLDSFKVSNDSLIFYVGGVGYGAVAP